MGTAPERNVAVGGRRAKRRPVLLWATAVFACATLLAAHFALRPTVTVTPATMSYLGDTCTVAFQAENHGEHYLNASLVVVTGNGSAGDESAPPSYVEYARHAIPVRLAPKERRRFSWDFPFSGYWRPNTARVEIVLTDERAR